MIRVLLFWLMTATAALAVQPDEMLEDPVLEERARELSKGLRCLVCRNESIDESNAELARDLRILVRDRIQAGDTDEEVLDFVVGRFGEYVLLNPPATGSTLILWFMGPALLVAGVGIAVLYLRKRRPGAVEENLSDTEKERLAQLLKE